MSHETLPTIDDGLDLSPAWSRVLGDHNRVVTLLSLVQTRALAKGDHLGPRELRSAVWEVGDATNHLALARLAGMDQIAALGVTGS